MGGRAARFLRTTLLMKDDPFVHDRIQVGDLFVKKWGKREIIWLALPRSPRSSKQPWLLMHTGNIESSYHLCRYELAPKHSRPTRRGLFRFIGTIPAWYLEELTQHTDW